MYLKPPPPPHFDTPNILGALSRLLWSGGGIGLHQGCHWWRHCFNAVGLWSEGLGGGGQALFITVTIICLFWWYWSIIDMFLLCLLLPFRIQQLVLSKQRPLKKPSQMSMKNIGVKVLITKKNLKPQTKHKKKTTKKKPDDDRGGGIN